MNIAVLEALIREYLETLDNTKRNEEFETDRIFAEERLEDFIAWLKERASERR